MISFRDVVKVFSTGKKDVRALDGLTVRVENGEFVAVMGPSGSGKSTLLHLAGALDLPTSGRVEVGGSSMADLTDADRTLLRRRRLGFVFQFFNLIPTFTVEENVALPLLLDGARIAALRPKIAALLDRVGLSGRSGHIPDELSGGEMQRVAVARALVTDPEILLADEPTGNLDSATGGEIMTLIGEVAREGRKTVVVVTHDVKIAGYAGRLIRLRDGRLDDGAPAAL